MDILNSLKYCIDSGMTQSQIGAATGRDQSTISDMLNHGIGLKNPSYEFVTKLQKLVRRLKQTTKTLEPL